MIFDPNGGGESTKNVLVTLFSRRYPCGCHYCSCMNYDGKVMFLVCLSVQGYPVSGLISCPGRYPSLWSHVLSREVPQSLVSCPFQGGPSLWSHGGGGTLVSGLMSHGGGGNSWTASRGTPRQDRDNPRTGQQYLPPLDRILVPPPSRRNRRTRHIAEVRLLQLCYAG